MNDIVSRFTFESFLVEDDGVVLGCLRQAEKLTAEIKREKEREKHEKELVIQSTASRIFVLVSSE